MCDNQYSAKLTGEPLLYNETKIIAKYIMDGVPIKELRKRNIEENLIHYKSKSAISRVNSPIFERIAVFNGKMLKEFVEGDVYNGKLLLMYSIMKSNNLVKDFMIQMYQDKILTFKDYIEQIEINNWFEKVFADSNLRSVSDTSKYKIKQVMIKIMIDSGLAIKEGNRYKIIIPILNNRYIEMLKDAGDIEYCRILGGIV